MPVCCYFNPRSLTGATVSFVPSLHGFVGFQSTLPHGSDPLWHAPPRPVIISIHAPSRERPVSRHDKQIRRQFQSTLPHGSDGKAPYGRLVRHGISIHAPSRERLGKLYSESRQYYFNPRSLTGATLCRGRKKVPV